MNKVTDNDARHVTGTTEGQKRNGLKDASKDNCKDLQEWCRRDVVVRSRHERQQRPEKLSCRQSTTVYDGRSVMTIMLSESNCKPQGNKNGGTPHRGTVAL